MFRPRPILSDIKTETPQHHDLSEQMGGSETETTGVGPGLNRPGRCLRRAGSIAPFRQGYAKDCNPRRRTF